MKKSLIISISTVLLLTATFSVSYCQTHTVQPKKTSYTDYLNILIKVPDLFKKWLNATEAIADGQDRKKFSGIAGNISKELTELQKIKMILKAGIDSGTISSDGIRSSDISRMQGHINQINALLRQTRSLTDKYNIDNAGSIINTLDIDFTGKVILFNDIVAKSKKPGEAKAVSNDLKIAIDIIEAARNNLDAFVTKLNARAPTTQ